MGRRRGRALAAGLLLVLAVPGGPAAGDGGGAAGERSRPSGRPAIHVHGGAAPAADAARLAAAEGLERLLRHSDVVLVYASRSGVGGGTPVLDEVHVYPGRGAGLPDPGVTAAAGSAPEIGGDHRARARRAVLAIRSGEADPAAVAVLSEALGSEEDPAIRERLARALGRARSEDAVAALASTTLTDPDEGVREMAASALGRTWSDAAVGPLLGALGDASAAVRAAAAEALGRTWSDEAASALAAAALADPSARVRETAMLALTHLGAEEAMTVLAAAAGDSSRRVRETALDVLAAMDPGPSAAPEPAD
jgi:HEAT repeat protein